MLTRLIGFVAGREPVLSAEVGLAGGWAALYAVLEAFDVLTLSPTQVAAIGALLAWGAAWWARSAVIPTRKLPAVEVVHNYDPLNTVEGDRRIHDAEAELDRGEHGGIPMAVLILAAGVLVLLLLGFATCDALFDDPDERDDLGAPAWVADNEPCSEEAACQNRSGDCRETQQGGYCSDDDLSPSFEDSPVRDSFNFGPVCMPMATCHFEGQPQEQPA